LYRKNFDAVDEIIVHGMPIGAMNHSQYTVSELSLNKDDVILLLSDGMPELQNNQNEMYGYERIRTGFNKVAKNTPQEIINYLKNESLNWLNDQDLEDDVTFVVLKAK
jgi:sigma-B regulation protein RsbU (phosphoserine phosphatase)